MNAPFTAWGASHWTVLVLFAIAAVVSVRLGRGVRGGPREIVVRRVGAAAVVAVALSYQIYSMLPANWSVGFSLPFQLCDLAWMAAALALWTGRQWAFALLYYWGLTLTSQGLLTPQLEHDFPHPQFLMFWSIHCLVVLAAVFMTWGLGRRPGWTDFRLAITATVVWGFAMLGFNALAGSNYLYVNRKPDAQSILDLLPPWPWYLLVELAIILLVWALMTWCWPSARHGRAARPVRSPRPAG